MGRDNISKCQETLRLDGEILHLIIEIERFDAIWPSIKNRDGFALAYLFVEKTKPDYKELLLQRLTFANDLEPNIFGKYEELMFEYDTESEIPHLIKCIVVVYKIYVMLKGIAEDFSSAIVIGIILFTEAGYDWISYIEFNAAKFSGIGINEWAIYFLSIVRDGQLLLLGQLDRYGVSTDLTLTEQLLIHLIAKERGITTQGMVNKIGKSEATVRRILAKLRRRNLICSLGKGKAICHFLTS